MSYHDTNILVRRETPNAAGGFTATLWTFRFSDDRFSSGPTLDLEEITREVRKTKRHKVQVGRIFVRSNRRDTHKDPASITPEDVREEARARFLAYLEEKLTLAF